MVQRKMNNSGCCDPISDLQLEIDQINEVATDAKVTANTASGRIDGALTSVNDLTDKVSGFDVKIDTNTANIATLQTEIDEVDTKANTNTTAISTLDSNVTSLKGKVATQEAKVDQLQSDVIDNTADLENLKPRVSATEDKIASLTPRVTTCEDAIDTLEGEIGSESTADTIRYRINQLETKVPTAIKEVTVTQDASTVYHNATKISGVVEKDALPVASRTQAGIMSASIYGSFEDQINNNSDRIAVLEQIGVTYDISGLVSSDPTDAEITAAFISKYPTLTITAGMRVADYNNAHFWQYGNNQWIALTQIVVNRASNISLGTVKGEESALGKVYVESDGSMSLNGYDSLVSKDTTHDSKIAALETWEATAKSQIEGLGATDTTLDSKISALSTRVSTSEGDIDDCETEISGLKTRATTSEGNVTALTTRVSTAESNIDTCETDIDALEGRMSTAESNISSVSTKATNNTTAINECASAVSSLSTRVTTIESSKQDKLIAGTGVTIASDGKTISASGKEYTAGSGISISSDGVISTTVPIGTYSVPLIVSINCNESLTIITKTANNYPTSPTVKTIRVGDTVTTTLSGTTSASTSEEIYFAYLTTSRSAVDVTIDLTSIIGYKNYTNCTITTLGISSNGYYYANKLGAYTNASISGSVTNGIFTGSVLIGSYRSGSGAVATTYYDGMLINTSSSSSQFTIAISTLSVNN